MQNDSKKNSFRFIHAADIHLDSPLKGLSKIENAPVEKLGKSSRQAFTKLIDLALDEQVDFVILAGDIFDHEYPDSSTRRFFIKQMARLSEGNIPAYIIWGNHDAKNSVFKKSELPKNIYCFGADEAQSIALDHFPITLHGQSYADNAVTKNLVFNYPEAIQNHFNIGLLHTSLDGAEGHGSYAPCELLHLKMKGYDYWALGHVHGRQELSQEPYIIYPGNIQGRHINERGEKGCVVVQVKELRVEEIKFEPLDFLRWELVTLDVSGLQSQDELIGLAKENIERTRKLHPEHFVALRLQLIGSTAMHWDLHSKIIDLQERLEDIYYEASGEFWLEDIKLTTTPLLNLQDRKDGFGDLILALEQVGKSPEFCQELMHGCDEIIQSIPEKLRKDIAYVNALTTGHPDDFISAVKDFAIARLCGLEKKP